MINAHKLYCVFSKEAIDLMKGSRGKLAAQAGHAYVHAVWDAENRFPESLKAYRDSPHSYKIGLVVPTEADLRALEESYRSICGVSLVTDAGFTIFDGPTTTCLGIGPIDVDKIKDDLKALKTLQ